MEKVCPPCRFTIGADVNCDVSHENVKRRTLLKSANSGHPACMTAVLEAGVDVDWKDSLGITALVIAATRGHHKCVELLLEAGADVNTVVQGGVLSGSTALIVAASKNNIQCVKILLQLQPDVNAVDISGVTTLYNAAKNGHHECLDLLIKAGADLNLADKLGDTPLIKAALLGHHKCVELLINTGADVNRFSSYGYTALIAAARRDRIQCVRLLLQSGADVNATDHNRTTTALLEAANCDTVACTWLLFMAGADVNMVTSRGYNTSTCALHAAARFHSLKLIKLLLKSGVHINKPRVVGGKVMGQKLVDKHWIHSGGDIIRLLFVAGEDQDRFRTTCLNLKEMCRDRIRRYLIRINPHVHLFDQALKLGLPTMLGKYLLYNMSLDDDTKGLASGLESLRLIR